jgi:hypothetical protein
MKSNDILLIFVIIFAVGFSLYRRLSKKNQAETGHPSKQQGSSLSSNPKDDEYEPYSRK